MGSEKVDVLVMPVLDVPRTEPLVPPVRLGRTRWWFFFLVLIAVGLAIAFAVVRQPEVKTDGAGSATTLPRPEWWQVLIAVIFGIIIGVYFVLYILRFVHIDEVTPT